MFEETEMKSVRKTVIMVFQNVWKKRKNGHLDGADVSWLREIFFHREEQIDRVLKKTQIH